MWHSDDWMRNQAARSAYVQTLDITVYLPFGSFCALWILIKHACTRATIYPNDFSFYLSTAKCIVDWNARWMIRVKNNFQILIKIAAWRTCLFIEFGRYGVFDWNGKPDRVLCRSRSCNTKQRVANNNWIPNEREKNHTETSKKKRQTVAITLQIKY